MEREGGGGGGHDCSLPEMRNKDKFFLFLNNLNSLMIVIYLYFRIISHQQTKPTSSKIKQFNNKHIDNKVASICVTGSTLK